MAIWLKEGKSESEIIEADEKVKRTVEGILNDVSKRGDEAVRELSLKFDNYSPESFILKKNEIENIVDKVNKKDLEDIKFAQDQVRNFALKQLECLADLEVETIPGVVLGHKNIPVNSVGCYVPGGKYPMVASAHMSVITASVASWCKKYNGFCSSSKWRTSPSYSVGNVLSVSYTHLTLPTMLPV